MKQQGVSLMDTGLIVMFVLGFATGSFATLVAVLMQRTRQIRRPYVSGRDFRNRGR
jgi:hypothetical protein